MSLTKRAVAAGGGIGATPTSSRTVSLSQKKRGTAAGEQHAKGTDTKVGEKKGGPFVRRMREPTLLLRYSVWLNNRFTLYDSQTTMSR